MENITSEDMHRTLLRRFHQSKDAAEALLYAARVIEYGDLDELAMTDEQVAACRGNDEARVRTLAAQALRQLAAGGLSKHVYGLAPEHAPEHLAPPKFKGGEGVISETSTVPQRGEVVACLYDIDRGWIYDVYWHELEAREEASRRGAPWANEAELKKVEL